jgi:hypothetical protein
LVIYQTYQINIGIGTGTEHSFEPILEQLDNYTTYAAGDTEVGIIGVKHQLQQIQSYPSTINKLRFLIEYNKHNSTTQEKKTTGSVLQYSTNFQVLNAVSSHNTQSHNEDTSCQVRSNSDQALHAAYVTDEKNTNEKLLPDWDKPQPLPKECSKELLW